MSLFETWSETAFNKNQSPDQLNRFWNDYFKKETSVYKELLKDPDNEVKGTVLELAEKFGLTDLEMTGFIDGINDSLKKKIDINSLEDDSMVSLDFDNEKLFRNMVDAKADWLYSLPEWNDIFTADEQKKLIHDQKNSHTVRNPKKIGRNDPCPCGSGKKYKYCCGRKNK